MEKINVQRIEQLKKIVVIGPECTGKSFLSSALASHYNTAWVPEFARTYIDQLGRAYEESDLLEIAKGQIALEEEKSRAADKLLICDTDLLVIKVWSEYKYGYCHETILSEIRQRQYNLYLLTYVDVPWEEDPQRENPHLRQYFYDIFKEELKSLQVLFVEIKGDQQERIDMAIAAIDKL